MRIQFTGGIFFNLLFNENKKKLNIWMQDYGCFGGAATELLHRPFNASPKGLICTIELV